VKVFIEKGIGEVILIARAEGSGGVVGDMTSTIAEGESVEIGGKTYTTKQLLDIPEGYIEI